MTAKPEPADETVAIEANYDGLVGLTHNYGGLSAGNLASQANAGAVSRPREAALQGLAKMKRLANRGLVQGVLPPHERPHVSTLRAAGFSGSDADVLERAWAVDARLVRNMSSSAAMWAANAATVSPSADTHDGRVHFTPANLHTMLHRSIEADTTRRALARAFPDPKHFCVHAPLPPHAAFSDEGAANHVRLCHDFGAPGVELFVYGREAAESSGAVPSRQSRLAGESIARGHGLAQRRVVHARQSRAALEAGAFHNDVVGVGSKHVMFFHERSFDDTAATLEALRRAADGLFEPVFVEVREDEAPLADVIKSYLFNSQLLAVPGSDRLVLIAPSEAEADAPTKAYCDQLTAGNGPIGAVEFVDVRQSMANGGGPACLRLRVVLTEDERAAAHAGMILDDALHDRLVDWVGRRYREELQPNDLGDPNLLVEVREALDELTQILDLGAEFYPFQRAGAGS